jgi:hypothetical protein
MVAILLFAVMSLAVCGLAEQAFATPAVPGSSGPTLPDGRAYELVSTSGNFGEPYQPASPLSWEEIGVQVSEHPFEAAEHGEAVTYVGEPPASGGTGETGPAEGNQWLATRTATGWTTQAITPALRNVEFPIYQAFAPDLSSGILQGGGGEPLSSEVATGCRSLYSRAMPTGEYRALFTASEVPGGGEPGNICGHPLLAGASKGEADVIFQSEAALTEEAEAATEVPPGHEAHQELGLQSGEPCMFGCNLYDAREGHLHLVNVLEGKPVPSANFGGYPGEHGFTDLSNAISEDGSRIFWTDTQAGEDFEHVFVLEDGTTNVQVSGAGPAEYWTASADGAVALYTEEGELWRFDTHTNTRERITPEGAGVLGVIGTNQTGENAAYIYLVAEGILAANENGDGQTAVAGEPNLYVIHGGTTFIGTLSSFDNRTRATSEGILTGGDWKAALGLRTAAVSPDGRHLVFQSLQRLTGYDNIILPNEEEVVEVFIYSAPDKELACASCDPTGAPPLLSVERAGLRETRLPVSNQSTTYMRRWMSTNGDRVFFDSEQPLVPQDANQVQDVYEWEREGTGGCTSENPPRPDRGCVYLLSGGSSRGYSFLIDADASGNNVFLEHQGPLGQVQAPSDRNELYDVRVDGGFPEASLACAGAGCQNGPPAPPSFASPASIASSGSGNFPSTGPPKPKPSLTRAQKLAKALKACRAKPRRKRAGCQREAQRRFGVTHASHAKGARGRAGK